VDADHLKERELATEKKNGAALATEAPSSDDVQLAVYVLKTTCTYRGTRRRDANRTRDVYYNNTS